MIDKILGRLEGVKQTSPNRWIAKCSAHLDKSPSLSLSQVDDRVLVHCHAGCAVEDVLAAIGLTFNDLYPPRPEKHRYGSVRRRIGYRGAWLVSAKSYYILCVAVSDLLAGKQLSGPDRESVHSAIERISSAIQEVGHG